MPKALQWLSGKSLEKRWKMDEAELMNLVEQGLPAYYQDLERVEVNQEGYPVYPSEMLFKPSDIENFENNTPWLMQQEEGSALSGKDLRELGQLRREKKKWHSSINVAVQIGIFCSDLDHRITRKELTDRIYKIDKDLPDTTIDKIWKAIPEEHRHQGGKPKNK